MIFLEHCKEDNERQPCCKSLAMRQKFDRSQIKKAEKKSAKKSCRIFVAWPADSSGNRSADDQFHRHSAIKNGGVNNLRAIS
jgi:hypothetical protein